MPLNMVKKPSEPIPPSKNDEFHTELSELLEKFIEEHEYVSRSDYDSDLVNFKHAEEFFAWLSKMAADEKISLRFEWSNNRGLSVDNLCIYLKINDSQYEHAQMNYKKSLEHYHQELEEYNKKYLQTIEEKIVSLQSQLKLMHEEKENLLNKR
jgi:hypothetical protein